MKRIEHEYQKNEWVSMYVNENGERLLSCFDTYDQAKNFLDSCYYKIGIVTTAFYNKFISDSF